MERLTVNDLNKVCYDPWELCGMDSYCKKGCHEEGGCTKGCPILKMYRKLAEYEEFEEIFRSKMTDATCKLLSDKEEFARWLDRNKWIAKKCDEYARAEEKGRLLKLPCAVGDTVWYISEKTEKHGRRNVTVSFVDSGDIDHITLGDIMIPQVTVCNSENEWITFDVIEDFGKTVFPTKEAAEQALKEMEIEE